MSEDELRRLLRADAARAPDPEVVWAGVERGLRRRRRREGVAAGAALLALAAALVGVAVVDVPRDPAPDERRVATAPPPTPTAVPTTTAPLDPATVTSTPADARRAFAAAGYTEQDAETLGELWQWGDVDDVVVVAGGDLLAGAGLPLLPGEALPEADVGGARYGFFDDIAAFGEAGWSGRDAERLAGAWDEDPATVTLHVGHLLLEGRLERTDAPPGP